MADTTEPVPGSQLEIPKASWIWIKDAAGFPSVTVTFAAIAFWVTTILYALSVVDHIGSLHFRQFDVAAASAYFVPVLTLYFGRRWTDAKMGVTPPKPMTVPGVNPRLSQGGDPQ